jgi:hypothetical protein
MGGSLADQWVQQWSAAFAKWAVDTAVAAVMALLQALGDATEPSFGSIGPTYNRMLAIALLLAGAFIAFALIERVLGGPHGAGWDVLPRTLFCSMGAFVALGVVEYSASFAHLLATAWNADLFGSGALMQSKVQAVYSAPVTGRQALGSAGGMFLVALITTLLALLIYIELILRAALILVTTTFLPLMCVMAIWPRQAGALRHLVEFMVALLMSKFVIATAVYIGFNLVAHGFGGGAPGQDAPNAMITGLATLVVAAFSPLLLLQGIKIAEAGTAQTVRHWGGHATKGASALGGLRLGARLSSAPARRIAASVGGLRKSGPEPKATRTEGQG